VTVYPTTELFRQASNQLGWMLGVTRGPAIALQPWSIVQQHGGASELLLHEFLHSMVESEAGGAAPLWLREGLVEALANERGEAPRMTTAQMDAVLQHADTQAESERSHHAACGLVRSLLAKYGLQTVRGWLRNGVPRGVVAGEQLGRDGEEQRQ
jgi:hypothetical protein